MNSSSSNLTPTQEKLILSALFIILFALEVVVVQHFFTSVVAGANDFYSRWYGAKAWILEGRDPYGLDVTAEIMPKLGFGPEEAARAAFAYPLPVVFTFWPLVYLPYDWTQAFWWVTVQWLAVGMAMGLLAWKRLQPRPLTMAAIILAMLFFYPVTRTIFLGQFTVHVAFLVIMTLVMLERGRDGWAGIFLSVTSIKPQMVILIGPWLVLWAIGQRRWRFLGGLLGGGAGLFLASWALFPRWPISFFEEIQRYQQVAGGRNPLSLLLATLWPSYPPILLTLFSVSLVGVMLYTWWQGWQKTGPLAERALFWTITVGMLVTFQTGTTNYTLLTIPFFVWLVQAQKRWSSHFTILFVLGVEVLAWAVFLATISGDFENPLLFLPYPFITLLVLLGQWLAYRRHVVST